MTLWRVRLSKQAETDLDDILLWTSETFGQAQATRYFHLILSSLGALSRGPQILGVRRRDDVGPDVFTLHIAPKEGQRGRHFLLLHKDSTQNTITVLRFLHDAMKLSRHLPDDMKN